MVVTRALYGVATVADDIEAMMVMVFARWEERMKSVAENRDAGVDCQQDVAQKLAMLGPHGAEGLTLSVGSSTPLFWTWFARKAMVGSAPGVVNHE